MIDFKLKKDFLFIESPLQLLNAYEAVNYFKLSSYRIIIRLSGKKNNDNQLLHLIAFLQIKEFEIININAKEKNFIDFCKIFFFICKYTCNSLISDRIFLGNFGAGFFSILLKIYNKNKVILLDDGSKTLSIQRSFSNINYYTLFSLYSLRPIKNQRIYKNRYSMTLNMLNDLDRKTDGKSVLFLGAKIAEIGMVKEEYYLSLMKEISIYYSAFNIIYIPHREENPFKLELISQYLNIKVKKIDYPVELYGIYENIIPVKVASFFSTALITMMNIYKLDVESFCFDYSSVKNKKSLDELYDYQEKYMSVIKLVI
ncbi:hypothetical protein V6255_11430 [Psychromonas arctica]|uniref:Uncharacterized protein n=1 Tax=Psychromonas arctica TaxID=168275 RepID=A0ABU9HCY8_9GAMM